MQRTEVNVWMEKSDQMDRIGYSERAFGYLAMSFLVLKSKQSADDSRLEKLPTPYLRGA